MVYSFFVKGLSADSTKPILAVKILSQNLLIHLFIRLVFSAMLRNIHLYDGGKLYGWRQL